MRICGSSRASCLFKRSNTCESSRRSGKRGESRFKPLNDKRGAPGEGVVYCVFWVAYMLSHQYPAISRMPM